LKNPFSSKTTILLTALTGADCASIFNVANQMAIEDGGSGGAYCAVRDFRRILTLKNVSTYQLRMRTTTWVCRMSAGSSQVTSATADPYCSINNMYTAGFAAPFTTPLTGFSSAEANDISTTIFQNPLWVQHFKALKVRNWVLMPYRSRRETIHCLRKKGGYIWESGQALQKIVPDPNAGYWNCIRSVGGITTIVKTIEIVGEIVNSEDAAPSPAIFTSPGVLLLQDKVEYDTALGGPIAQVYTIGDPAPEAQTVALTGQPWNYMFPGPSSTSSIGTSSVVGALSSGI